MKQKININKIKGNPGNPRIIKNDKFKKLVKSIEEFPEMLELRPIVVDENMMILGGNMRWKASKELGLKEVWIDTATGLSEEQKKEFIVKDNVSFGEWEWDVLANQWDSVEITDWGLDVWQNEDDVKEKEKYTGKIETPKYEPTGVKPGVQDLYNTEKADKLIEKIKAANLDKAEEAFLIHAAYRHTVFNYKNIAEYYIHSSKEVQELMEDNALVIIDFKKAIEGGYISLNEQITNNYLEEHGE
tara:strand:+ start:3305 stop:4036 length:732 start_codon:yes stop_codon:yes gene_type:complete